MSNLKNNMLDTVFLDACEKIRGIKPTKESCAELFFIIEKLLWLYDFNRHENVFYFEKEIENIWPSVGDAPCGGDYYHIDKKGLSRFAAYSLQLYINGTEKEKIENLLCDKYFANDYKGIDAIGAYIVIQATLMMFEFYNVMSREAMLIGILPDEFEELFYEVCRKENDIRKKEDDKLYRIPKEFFDEDGIDTEIEPLDNFVIYMMMGSRIERKKILKELNHDEMALLVYAIPRFYRNLILDMLPKKEAYEIYLEVTKMQPPKSLELLKFLNVAEKAEKIVMDLKIKGEISLSYEYEEHFMGEKGKLFKYT